MRSTTSRPATSTPATDRNTTIQWRVSATIHALRGPEQLARQVGTDLVVCEGIPDALTAASLGYSAVGVLGSQAPDRNVADTIVARAAGVRVVVVNDHDDAGRTWSANLVDLLADRGADVVQVEPPTVGCRPERLGTGLSQFRG